MLKHKKENNTVYLEGMISDSFEPEQYFKGALGAEKLDIGGVKVSSWIGLSHLSQFLSQQTDPVEVHHVPAKVYKILRLQPEYGLNYFVKSFGIESVSSEDGMSIIEKWYELDVIQEKVDQKKGEFHQESGQELVGYLHYTVNHENNITDSFEPKVNSLWYMAHGEKLHKWMSYIYFYEACIETCLASIETLKDSVTSFSKTLKGQAMQIEFALKIPFPTLKLQSAGEFDELLKTVEQTMNKLIEDLEDLTSLTTNMFVKLQKVSQKDSFENENKFYQVISAVISAILAQQELADKVETLGTECVSKVLSMEAADHMRKNLDKIDESKVSAETITMIAHSLKMKSVTRQTSWAEMKDLIVERLESFETQLYECIVMMQGVDAVKQIVENRVKDLAHLKDRLPLNVPDGQWDEFSEELMTSFSEHLVTEQERTAFLHYFKEMSDRVMGQDNHPGEVLLF